MHSMTGFGRAEHATNSILARVEAASVNRKQSEVVVQLPRAYAELEATLRKAAIAADSPVAASTSAFIWKSRMEPVIQYASMPAVPEPWKPRSPSSPMPLTAT